ncbi:MAG: peptide chain release factor 1 [Bacteroidetes bacterium]|nr:MAG: peptide chain release factor 1 [Bacteroidota bacterium]
MLETLEEYRSRWEEVGEQMTDPEIIADNKKYSELHKEYKRLQEIVDAHKEYVNVLSNIDTNKEILNNEKDDELKEMAKEELETLNAQVGPLEARIKLLLIPKDPEDSKNAIVEIRAGTGGDEASLFAGDLYRMYLKYADSKGWKVEEVDKTDGTVGGFKEVILNFNGENVYGQMKYESGVHRVQRVPQTESQGRVHTSAASVAVLPEADEFDVEIKQADIRKDTFCSSGPGGQSVNTTYSAIRLTHIPTGLVAQCQDQKSQIKNYDKALKVLRSRLYEQEYKKRMDEISSKRKTMVSTGDRSAKIRTYNYPQGRVTEHRINLTLYNLNNILEGDIQEIIDSLQIAENTEKLNESVA